MNLTSIFGSVSSAGVAWLQAADVVAKASILLGAAAVASLTLRRASASLRHLVWTLALIAALAVPALSLALPRWSVPVITIATQAPAAAAAADTLPQPTAPLRASRSTTPATMRVEAAPAAPVTPSPGLAPASSWRVTLGDIHWETLAIGLWLTGFLAIVARLLVGLIAVQWMSRRTETVTDAPWLPLARRLSEDLGVPRVTFLRSPRATMPMAWGIVKPAVLMPRDADEWPADRLRIVLLHELAHVRRRDCLTHLLAQAACAVYWFHPLAWMAARRARAERERACDDLVLAMGTRGSDYAEELLEIARVMRSGRFPAVLAGATLAMAHRSQLEGRLLAILDPRIPRRGVTRVGALATSMACLLAIVPLAALQPWTNGESDVNHQRAADAAVPDPSALQMPNMPAPPRPRGDRTPTPAPAPPSRSASPAATLGEDQTPRQQTERAAPSVASATATTVVAQVATQLTSSVVDTVVSATHSIESDRIDAVLAGLASAQTPTPMPTPTPTPTPNPNPNPNPNPSPIATGRQVRRADPRTVAALTAALKDTDKEVRETAMHALVQMRDPAIFDPLVEALRDASADVREQAAFGLGQLRDKRAVDPLMAAVKDANGSVREQAVFALGQLRDARAVDALFLALKDTIADVREKAAFALGQLRDTRATAALAAALSDVSDDVREQVVFALGQLRDPAAVDGLMKALKDARPKVRQQAAFSLGQIRDRKAIDGLVAALKDSSSEVRHQAAFALGQLRDAASVEPLVFALKDSDAEVREQAAFALGQLRDPRAIDGLTAALKDTSPKVRQQAAFALGQLAR